MTDRGSFAAPAAPRFQAVLALVPVLFLEAILVLMQRKGKPFRPALLREFSLREIILLVIVGLLAVNTALLVKVGEGLTD